MVELVEVVMGDLVMVETLVVRVVERVVLMRVGW